MSNSENFITHRINTEDLFDILTDFSTVLMSIPVSLDTSNLTGIDSNGGFLTNSIFTCSLQVLALNPINRSAIGEDLFTPLTLMVSSDKVVFSDTEEMTLLRPIDVTGKGTGRKQASVTPQSKISCAFRHPHVLVKETQCNTMIKAIGTTNNLTVNVEDLRKLPHYPAFVVQGKNEIKAYEPGTKLVCSDAELKNTMEEMFYSFDKLSSKWGQLCSMFGLKCGWRECGFNLGQKSLSELNEVAMCLINRGGVVRTKRETIFSSLLQGLGLIKSASQISMDNFNKINRGNFDKIKQEVLKVEAALIAESDTLHSALAKDGKALEETFDRVSQLSSHVHMVQRLNHVRSQHLAVLQSFSKAFSHLTENIDGVLGLALAPLSKKSGIFCRETDECVDLSSLILHSTEKDLSVSARLLKIETVKAGRVSCELRETEDGIMVHGMTDRLVVKRGGVYIDFESNKEVTSDCLESGENCPRALRSVGPRDLMMENIYFSIDKKQMRAQCINQTILVMATHNVTCNMKATTVSVPFIILSQDASHLVDSHNLHMYLAIPRKVTFADEEIWHGFKNPITNKEQKVKREDFGSFSLQNVDLTNPFHSFIVISPFLVCLLSFCCCCLMWKYPSCPKKFVKCTLKCCKKKEDNKKVVVKNKTRQTDSDAPEEEYDMHGGLPPVYKETAGSSNKKYHSTNSSYIKECMRDSKSSSKLRQNMDPNETLNATDRAIDRLGNKINYKQ